MATKIRKQIYIEPHREVILKRLSRKQRAIEIEIIHGAIGRYTRAIRLPRRDLATWEEGRAFIQSLIQQSPVPGRRAWWQEDLHER
ncbi:MAG: hypothetical protein RML36_14870 [Anaerolineae bacterium]|nr:hypothetical protein [Anaerolineae bacterium]MDW8100754.1 hypothetical protein [Anaerolineae bacterium]